MPPGIQRLKDHSPASPKTQTLKPQSRGFQRYQAMHTIPTENEVLEVERRLSPGARPAITKPLQQRPSRVPQGP